MGKYGDGKGRKERERRERERERSKIMNDIESKRTLNGTLIERERERGRQTEKVRRDKEITEYKTRKGESEM